MVQRGDIWWAELAEPFGSGPGFKRPVVIIQSDLFNLNGIQTVIVASMTGNARMAGAAGNVMVPASASGLKKDSVVNVTQLFTLDLELLTDYAGTVPPRLMTAIGEGLRLVMNL